MQRLFYHFDAKNHLLGSEAKKQRSILNSSLKEEAQLLCGDLHSSPSPHLKSRTSIRSSWIFIWRDQTPKYDPRLKEVKRIKLD